MAGVIAVITPERRIENNPYDVEAWNLLLRDSQRRPIEQVRPFYDKLIQQFPNAGRFWKVYIEHELKAKYLENVEKIFQRCLVKVLNIELWKCYLNYVRDTKAHLPQFREKMAQAYDFALEKVGMDMLSYPIYADYISFLKAVPAVGSYAENQKISAIRKVYLRGIVTPLLNIEILWGEYCVFEKSINPTLAEKLIAEKSKDYQNARRVSKGMEAVVRGINRNIISVPPRGTAAELKQTDSWKKYIQWEKTNPLQTEDYSLFTRRVVYAYDQALLCLGYHADIWYEAALFMQEASKTLAEKGDAKTCVQLADDVSALYERATTTLLKDNLLLYFAYADYEEERMKYEKVHAIYKKFIAIPAIDPTLVYIQYMKFARRTEGIKSARTVFRNAREDARTKCQVYVAAALMEYYCSKDTKIAINVFDLGLKKYGDLPEFALAYIEFLSHLNEDNNSRVLFERILTSGHMAPEKSLEVWDRYLEFESLVGDLNSILKVDKRRRQAMEKDYSNYQTLLLIDRYKFMDLLPCAPLELKVLGYRHGSKSSSQAGSSASGSGGNFDKASLQNALGIFSTKLSDSSYPKPDVAQMIPFKPKIITTSSYHPVAGGVFPPPPAVAHLLSLLPPPYCFNGPFVGVDALIDKFKEAVLPEDSHVAVGIANGDPRADEIKKDFYQLLANTPDPLQVLNQEGGYRSKRHWRNGGAGDSDDESGDAAQGRPINDIYLMRKQMKKSK